MCFRKTLKTFPESKLAQVEQLAHCYNHERREYFFDRNPHLFQFILDACRRGVIHLPKDICGIVFREEMEYWGLAERQVAPCCWEALYRGESELKTMQMLVHSLRKGKKTRSGVIDKSDIKYRVWQFLDEQKSSKMAMIWCVFISMVILGSTLMQALATLPAFQVTPSLAEQATLRKYSEWYNTTFGRTKPHPYIIFGDLCCHSILTMETLVAFVVCPNKQAFLTSSVRIIVFAGYISYWIDLIMEMNLEKMTTVHALRAYIVFKYLNVLMLGRLFYITRHLPAFKIMGLTFRSSKQELKILGFMLGILVCVFGFAMFISELLHQTNINNVFVGMYWALVTLTTVGYGRYVPYSVLGHIIAAACALCGVLVLALPIGVIASTFYTFYNYHKYAAKHLQLTN
ncbi:potassium voltage-gated channel protein Shaw-like [Mya arenaria]|uniref:potassium voltage-gated channel protein Shaw-like n=1 Tax=Mya arenaria TaxID=6604 RepID=UPI0022E203C4|nr:potassium voltage-gated channel protein Shaw-like [Mya arenaria]